MKRKNCSIIAVLVGILLLPACGYHLRGAMDVPQQMHKVYLEGASSALRGALLSSLRGSDAALVASPGEAGFQIKVIKDDMRRRVLSLNASGKATEYELNYTLVYVLLDEQGKALGKQQVLEVNRDYFNDQEDILAKNNEEAVIRDEIYRNAVRSMLMRASALLKK